MPRRKRRSADLAGAALILIVVAVLGVGAWVALRMQPPPLDPETLCVVGNPPPADVLILADGTDRLLKRHQKRLRAAVETEVARLPAHARLSVFTLEAASPREPRLLFSKCDPGRGSDVNPLFANPRAADTLRRDAFIDPLLRAISIAGTQSDGAASPLIEGLWAVATDPDMNRSPSARRLILISDRLQHDPHGFSLYASGQTYESHRANAANVTPDLTNISVRVIVLDRPQHDERQAAARDQFWTPFLEAAGAKDFTFVD
jgi:hypothetical protein